MALFARKNSTFQKERWRSAHKISAFFNVSYLATKMFQQLRTMFFLKHLLIILIFFTTTRSDESTTISSRMIITLWRNSHRRLKRNQADRKPS